MATNNRVLKTSHFLHLFYKRHTLLHVLEKNTRFYTFIERSELQNAIPIRLKQIKYLKDYMKTQQQSDDIAKIWKLVYPIICQCFMLRVASTKCGFQPLFSKISGCEPIRDHMVVKTLHFSLFTCRCLILGFKTLILDLTGMWISHNVLNYHIIFLHLLSHQQFSIRRIFIILLNLRY